MKKPFHLLAKSIKFLFIFCFLFITSFVLYDFLRAIEVTNIEVPGDLSKDYIEASDHFSIPWEYLAAIDEVQNNYRDVTRSDILNKAKWMNNKMLEMGGISKKNLKKVIEQQFSNSETAKILNIVKTYESVAAPMDEDYLFPFKQSDRKKVSYEDTWGASRSFGGKRQHEGTDLMTEKGVPLLAVSESIVIRKGWNQLGGWRITLLDLNHPQISYYYAHLSEFAEGLTVGEKVNKGEIIGYVGDSGYGPEGTTGKFPPHLHFGIYARENWFSFQSKAINPYPFLRAWDDIERK